MPSLIFKTTPLAGVFEIETKAHEDERGLFARLYCPEEFTKAGIKFSPTQINLSTNVHQYTLRGMHYKVPEKAEAKLVRAIKGKAYDVALDMRENSPTFGQWHAVELDADKNNAIFLPEGIAHGFLTLEPDTHLLYQMGRNHEQGGELGIRWNDPAFKIQWPCNPHTISIRDNTYILYED
jgi:dTDP-4-dehydrorhamnose 3,5-epimerase